MTATVQKLRPDDIRRLLIIGPPGLGGAVLLIPTLRALRAALPKAEIHWLVAPADRSIAELVPYADVLIERKGHSIFRFLSSALALRRLRFDAVIDFDHRSWTTAILAVASGAGVRLGFYVPGQLRAKAYTEVFWKYFAQHEAQEYLGLAGMLTPIVFDPSPEIWESANGRHEAEMLGLKRTGDGPLVVLHPGCGDHGGPLEWPLPNFAVLGHWLIQKHGAQLVLTAGRNDRKITADLMRLLNNQATNLGGRTSLPALVTILKTADLVISGSTGVMHLAAALKRPQVALFGPADPRLWGPANAKARVVTSDCPSCPSLRFGSEYHRKDPSCMARIGVEGVKAAVEASFDNGGDI